MTQDFVVYLHERYGMTKEEFFNSIKPIEFGNIEKEYFETLKYEETSCVHVMPNVDYDKLYVGARLYMDESNLSDFGSRFKEIEVTHLYGGIMFFRWLEGKNKGKEEYLPKGSFGFMRTLYPKIIYKPPFKEFVCDCDRTIFLNY